MKGASYSKAIMEVYETSVICQFQKNVLQNLYPWNEMHKEPFIFHMFHVSQVKLTILEVFVVWKFKVVPIFFDKKHSISHSFDSKIHRPKTVRQKLGLKYWDQHFRPSALSLRGLSPQKKTYLRLASSRPMSCSIWRVATPWEPPRRHGCQCQSKKVVPSHPSEEYARQIGKASPRAQDEHWKICWKYHFMSWMRNILRKKKGVGMVKTW